MSSFMRGILLYISMGIYLSLLLLPLIYIFGASLTFGGVRNRDEVVKKSLCGIGRSEEVLLPKTNKCLRKIIKSPKDLSRN